MAGEQSVIPRFGFVNETDDKQNLVPGVGFVNETVAAGGASANLSGFGLVGELGASLVSRSHAQSGQEFSAAQGAATLERSHLPLGQQVDAVFGSTDLLRSSALASVLATFEMGELSPYATQFARPTADVSDGIWLPSTGADLYATIDEVAVDDGDYDYAQDPSADEFEVQLGALTDPLLSTGHKVRYRLLSVDGTCDFTVQLRQGASTVIASWDHLAVGAVTTFEQTLSGVEADAITNYNDLRLRFSATRN